MEKFCDCLINILKVVMCVLIGILTITSFAFLVKLSSGDVPGIFLVLEFGTLVVGSVIIFLNIKSRYKIGILLLLALILRAFWIITVKTMPVSDFATMYETASNVLAGNFEGMNGYGYLGRFPHLVPMTLYISGIMKIFGDNTLVALKILNVLFSTATLYLLYILAGYFIKSEKSKLFVILIGAIFPAFITYTSVLCTENVAIPLYIATLILFFKSKELSGLKQIAYFLLTGVMLAFSNLFRGVAIVFLIAFLIYLVLCTKKRRIVNSLSVVGGYLTVTVVISAILISLGVIERPLWAGTEPSYATLLLKGSNFENNGMWNYEDANFVEEHLRDENLAKLCIEKVEERILSKSPSELILFYAKKFASQWSAGDASGTYWAYVGANINMKSIVSVEFQLIYAIIMLLAFVGVFRSGNNSLVCIILFGFIMLFDIIETQPRYSYIIVFAFVLLAGQGLELISDFIKRERKNGSKSKKFLGKYFFK